MTPSQSPPPKQSLPFVSISFRAPLGDIEARTDSAPRRLERYTELYGSVLRRGRMCMCGMLAADVATLPKPMRASIAGFFSENEQWLTRILAEGRKRGEIAFEGTPSSLASFFVSSLEGAMLVARASGNDEPFDAVVRHPMARVQSAAEKNNNRRR